MICAYCGKSFRQGFWYRLLDMIVRAKPVCSSFCNNMLVMTDSLSKDSDE
jgi:hypothetical protein